MMQNNFWENPANFLQHHRPTHGFNGYNQRSQTQGKQKNDIHAIFHDVFQSSPQTTSQTTFQSRPQTTSQTTFQSSPQTTSQTTFTTSKEQISTETGFINHGNFCYLNAVTDVLCRTRIFKNFDNSDVLILNFLGNIYSIKSQTDASLLADIVNDENKIIKKNISSCEHYNVATQSDACEFLLDIFNILEFRSNAMMKQLFEYSCVHNKKKHSETGSVYTLDLPFTTSQPLQRVFDCYDNGDYHFTKFGEYFVVYFKRFGGTNNDIRKKSVPIIMSNQIVFQKFRFEPIAVIEHIGNTLRSGHYVSYRKIDSKPNCWAKTNNTHITEVQTQDIINPYIIFFKKM